MGNDCWYYRAQYAGMTKVCMRQSIVECGRIRRFGLCPIPPDSEAWRRCGFAIGQHEIPVGNEGMRAKLKIEVTRAGSR